jgi:hypothetical protein
MGLGLGLIILSCKKKIVEKPSRNSAAFCGGGQGISWAVGQGKKKEGRRRIFHQVESNETPLISQQQQNNFSYITY